MDLALFKGLIIQQAKGDVQPGDKPVSQLTTKQRQCLFWGLLLEALLTHTHCKTPSRGVRLTTLTEVPRRLSEVIQGYRDLKREEAGSWRCFKNLLGLLWQVVSINNIVYPGVGDPQLIILEVISVDGFSILCSLRTFDTKAYEERICSSLPRNLQKSIKLNGKIPTKEHDGPNINYTRKVSNTVYNKLLEEIEKTWDDDDKQRQSELYQPLLDELELLMLYWCHLLCLEGTLQMEREKFKSPCHKQLKKVALTCIDEKGGMIREPHSFRLSIKDLPLESKFHQQSSWDNSSHTFYDSIPYSHSTASSSAARHRHPSKI